MSEFQEFDEIVAEYEAGARKGRILSLIQVGCFALLLLTLLAATVYATVIIPEWVHEIISELNATEV